MKITKMILTSLVLLGIVVLFNPVAAQTTGTCPGTGVNFVDADGDGYNDNAKDADGDGIPNGMDDDYVSRNGGSGNTFVDADGDGINDNARDADGDGIPNGMDDDFVKGSGLGNSLQNNGTQMGGYGPRDGTGNRNGGGNR